MTESPIEQSEASGERGRRAAAVCFSTAVGRYETPLLRYAGQMLHGDHEQAQDIVQEAFLRLHRQLGNNGMTKPVSNPGPDARHDPQAANRGRFARSDDLTARLYRVVHNLVIDTLRRRKRHAEGQRRLAENAPATATATEGNGLDNLIQKEACHRAVAEMQNLTDTQRQVMLLKTVAGLTLRQIGRITGLTPGNAGYHLRQGLAELTRRLKQQEVI